MCKCGIDHWLWVVSGLDGLVGMVRSLSKGNVPISDAAREKFTKQLEQLIDLYQQVNCTARHS
jgi:hypothetical protein